jgi:hypothetical protein
VLSLVTQIAISTSHRALPVDLLRKSCQAHRQSYGVGTRRRVREAKRNAPIAFARLKVAHHQRRQCCINKGNVA